MGLAAAVALALGIAVGWTVQAWQPSPSLGPVLGHDAPAASAVAPLIPPSA